jgi:hypothetical protein
MAGKVVEPKSQTLNTRSAVWVVGWVGKDNGRADVVFGCERMFSICTVRVCFSVSGEECLNRLGAGADL